MTAYWFYHMQQSPLEQVLPDILEKISAKGWKCLTKFGNLNGDPTDEMKRWDDYLWSYRKDAFLPHGRDDEPLADRHPLCLTTDADSAGANDIVILVHGAEMKDVAGTVRCITFLDGANEQDRKIARTRWKNAKDAGHETSYWRQDDHGKWVQPDL